MTMYSTYGASYLVSDKAFFLLIQNHNLEIRQMQRGCDVGRLCGRRLANCYTGLFTILTTTTVTVGFADYYICRHYITVANGQHELTTFNERCSVGLVLQHSTRSCH